MEQEIIAEKKELWLQERGLTFKDVMEDERGEYVLQEPELMDENEPEDGKFKQVYLPEFSFE